MVCGLDHSGSQPFNYGREWKKQAIYMYIIYIVEPLGFTLGLNMF